MILWNSETNCEEARGYYYDWIDGQCQAEVPKVVQTHVCHCDHCQAEINRLAKALRGASISESDMASDLSMVNAMLKMHFKYADTPVTCDLAKRFFPSMAALGSRITIPTPITVHIEQCDKCRHDWVELQSLGLSDVQFERLTECLGPADGHASLPGLPGHAHFTDEQVQTFARVDYADFDTACLSHVCQCAACRERTAVVRATAPSRSTAEPDVCEEVSWEDLFDLVMPWGFNPLVDEYAQFRKATVEHVRDCETCQRRLGQLDRILLNLQAPRECGVVTHYELAFDETPTRVHAEYEDYPIRVAVQGSPTLECTDLRDQTQTASGHGPVRLSSRWIKVAAAVAVFLGITLFSIMPNADAGLLDQVYKATAGAPVVHFQVYVGEGSTASVASEYWIMPPDRAVVRERQTWEDRNVSAGWIKTAQTAGMAAPILLSSGAKEEMQKSIRGLYDLWPFEASQAATKVSDEHEPFDVYELPVNTFVWRATVDRATQRVVKVDRLDADRTVMRSFHVTYPSVSTFKAFLQQHHFNTEGL